MAYSSLLGQFLLGFSVLGGASSNQFIRPTKRTWGRTYDEFGNATWVMVTPDSEGNSDALYLTAIAQVIQLQLNESPFYANYGIPAQQSVMTQIYPDYYAMKIQEQFSNFFASLLISREPQTNPPMYNVQAITHKGAILGVSIAT